MASESYPSWSPDGESIAFWRQADKGDELVVAPVLGGPAQVLFQALWQVYKKHWQKA